MSINVNVSGNPVRINRGKLISTDPDYAKKEFEKRRRMRLEQVRHQSKEIAENVRGKVRKEQNNQLSEFERREEERHKRWQNRKLLELQQQHKESLKDVGLAHAHAAIEETREDIESEYRKELNEKARERGQKAGQTLQVEKNKQNLKKAISQQQKKLSRDVENARAVMVAKTKKTPTKKRRKSQTNINITTNVCSEDDSESDVEALELLSDSGDYTRSDTPESGARRKRTMSPSSESCYNSKVPSPKKISTKADVHRPLRDSPRRPHSHLESIQESIEATNYPVETRISDRIKNRRYLIDNPCDQISHPERVSIQSERLSSTNITNNRIPSAVICGCKCSCGKQQSNDISKTEIPLKPTVSLKNIPSGKDIEQSSVKVQYYDHKNRFSKESIPPSNTSITKIPDNSIEVCGCLCPCREKQLEERQYKNDKDAEERGRKAMEKINVHKDYREMMKQLPVLQNRERVALINSDKPIFHMDDERLKERERSKQNRMENSYERHFPKTITIPPKKHSVEIEAFKTIDVPTSKTVTKGAKWDEDKFSDNGFTLTKDSGNITIEKTEVSASKKEDYLRYLLERLKRQKEMLLREAAELPQSSNLNNIISELESLHSDGVEVSEVCQEDCVDRIQPDLTKKDDKKPTKHKLIGESVLTTSSSSTSSTPTKRRKQKRIILQNMSTQTSPKPIVENINDNKKETKGNTETIKSKEKSSKLKKTTDKATSAKKTKTTSPRKDHVSAPEKDRTSSPMIDSSSKRDRGTSPIVLERDASTKEDKKVCTCNRHSLDHFKKDDICEILIKIKENDVPEVKLKSSVEQVRATEKTEKKPQPVKPKRSVKINDRDSSRDNTKGSWKDYLSRNDNVTSTSTSYFSPPDYSKSNFPRKPQAQSTSYTDPRKMDPRLLKYIKKLLEMSRMSIDELGVSSATDISTPSVTPSEDNNSLNRLRNIIRYFNLNPQELAQCLSFSEDTSSTINKTNSSARSSGYEASKSPANNTSTSQSDGSKLEDRSGGMPQRHHQIAPEERYAALAELCQKRITELATMIDKVRMEKQQILSPTGHSDKENSTQYMKLPLSSDAKSPDQVPDTSSDLEQAALTKKMLEIDYDLAERLRNQGNKRDAIANAREMSEFDKELLERYRKLMEIQEEEIRDIRSSREESPDLGFTPILDIPRLPKLVANVEEVEADLKKPPPAKGLMAAKRFNGDITGIPHELSTIVEVDSQLSARFRPSSSPQHQVVPQMSAAPIQTIEDFNPVIVLPEMPPNWVEEKSKVPQDRGSSDGSMPDIVAEIGTNTDVQAKNNKAGQIRERLSIIPLNEDKHKEINTDTSTDKSEADNIEAMLKSMGMGWALSTLKKTKEAFEMPSSSSDSSKHISATNTTTNTSDVTLRDSTGKKLFGSSTSTSSSLSKSISLNLTKGYMELTPGASSETKLQRTSTPLQTKSAESKKGELLDDGASVSSVKLSDAFLTMKDSTGDNSDL